MESTTELELKVRTEGKRLVELDALRGIAAVIVVGHHMRLFTWRFPLHWYSVPLFAGAQSVALFLVLSGFVLSLPYWRDRQLPYPTYVGRRLARIYLPYLAAAVLSVVADLVFRSSPAGLDHYFYGVWHSPVTPGSLWRLACIWPQASYNVSFWSLRYEMQLSVALPGLLWLLRRFPNRWVLLGSFTLANASTSFIERLQGFHLLGTTIQIAWLFLLGAAMARNKQRLADGLRRLGTSAAWAVFAISLLLFFNFVGELAVPGVPTWIADRGEMFSGFGAAGLILCALNIQPIRRALCVPLFEYLGRISYSLYLVHSVTLVATLDLLYGRVPAVMACGVALLVSAVGAHLFCVVVEEPCIRLSKRVHFAPRVEHAFTAEGVPG